MYRDMVSPDAPAFRQLGDMDPDRPFGMLNMLAFRKAAVYAPEDPEFTEPEVSGEAAFGRYVRENLATPDRAPGGMAWQGVPLAHLICPEGEQWDLIFLRRYETVSSFLRMISSPAYQRARRHRVAALADSRLIVCAETDVLSGYAR